MTGIYLDHNATTPVEEAVVQRMAEVARTCWANPSSGHGPGQAARARLEEARGAIAACIGASAPEILFTSGGTESDNLALIGAARANRDRGRHVIVSAVEHHAVLESCSVLEREGFEITRIPVDRYGRVDPDDLEASLRRDTILASIMHANNEVGTVQPAARIGALLRRKGVLFHCDAAQSLGKIPVHVEEMQVDLLAGSAHKIYGPKGVGLLYVRRGTRLAPLLVGGGQEGGLRSGTENLPGIAGLEEALKIALRGLEEEARSLARLRDDLFEGLRAALDGLHLNGHPEERLPGTLSLRVQGVRSADLIGLLRDQGVSVSASAACTTGSIRPSHVLAAMGATPEEAAGTIRISLGRSNNQEEIARAARIMTAAVRRLRGSAS